MLIDCEDDYHLYTIKENYIEVTRQEACAAENDALWDSGACLHGFCPVIYAVRQGEPIMWRHVYANTKRATIASALALLLMPSSSRADNATISVTDVRPVAAAARRVEELTHNVVTYEDGVIVCPEDLRDATIDKETADRLGRPHHFGPKWGKVTLQYAVKLDGTPDAPLDLINSLVIDGNDQAIKFTVKQVTASRFQIYPREVRDRQCKWTAFKPALETPITILPAERDGVQFVKQICTALTVALGAKVSCALAHDFALARFHVSMGVSNVPARDVLEKLLESVDNRISWAFQCDESACALNLHRETGQYVPPALPKAKPLPAPPPNIRLRDSPFGRGVP